MSITANVLTQVQTFQRSGLGYLENLNCFLGAVTNKKFKDFQNTPGNLGTTVTYDLPPRYTTTNGLIANIQPSVQRLQPLTVDQGMNVGFSFTAQERIFNVEKDTESYMKTFGMSAIKELGGKIESSVAMNCNSSMPFNDNAGNPTGALHVENGPYRFFGDGVTQINSFQQLSQMVTNFVDFGAVDSNPKIILANTMIPAIVGNGLNQFATSRNDKLANSWEIGGTSSGLPGEYFISNLLPIQNAGTVGNSSQTLTLVSTNDPTGNNITQLTLSGATNNDPNAIKSGDLLQFIHTTNYIDLRFLTFIAHTVSQQPVQIRATANAAANGSGNVTISILPSLQSTPGATQNLNTALVAGMRVTALPSHRAGLVVGGDSFFLAMPQLPKQDPFATANEYDMETGASIRMTYGATFGQNQQGMVYDAIWGASLNPDYCMRIAIPL